MKKKILVLFTCLAVVACGNKDKKESSEEGKKDEKETEETTEAKSNGIIDPSTYDFSQPVEADKIYKSIMFYYNTEFQFLVYPYNNKIIDYTQAYSDPDMKDLSFDFRLTEAMEKELAKGAPIVIKGKIVSTYYNRVNVEGASIVSEGKAEKTVPFDANKHVDGNIYNPRDLYNAIVKWESKQVTIKGTYQMYTQSGGSTILERRIDVGATPGEVIGCNFKEDPGVGDKLNGGKDQVTIKGTISYVLHYSRPYMDNCELVK